MGTAGNLFGSSLTRALKLLILTPCIAWSGDDLRKADYANMSLDALMALEVFTSASLLPTKKSQAPGTVYSFNRVDFRRFGIRRLEDILQFVPGLQLNQYRKRHRAIWGRGLLDRYNDKFSLMVDGVQVRHLYYGHFSLGDNLPLEKIDRVEIILGPASSLYGANAFGGVISVTTRDFVAEPEVEATLEFAANHRAKTTWMYNSGRLQIFASHLDQEAPFREDRKSFIGGEVLQPLDEDFSSLLIKTEPIKGLTLSLDYNHNNTPFLFIPSTQDAFIKERSLALAANYRGGDLEVGQIEATVHLLDDRWFEYEVEQWTRKIGYEEHQDALEMGGELNGFKRFGEHVLGLGVTWKHEEAEDMDFIRSFRFDRGFFAVPESGSLLAEPGVKTDDYALFLQDVWQLNAGLELTLGARYDYFEQFEGYLNRRAALVYTLDSHQTWKLLYGTAIRKPSWREHLKVLEGTPFTPPQLKAEFVKSWELGYQLHWQQSQLEVNMYYNEMVDAIHQVPTPDGEDEYYANRDSTWRSSGVEMLYQWRYSDRVNFYLALAYLDAETSGNGDLPYLASWSSSLNLDYNYFASHHIGVSFAHNSDRKDSNQYNNDNADAFWVANLFASGRINDAFSYALGVDNLFDLKVYDPAADFGRQHNPQRSERELWLRIIWTPPL